MFGTLQPRSCGLGEADRQDHSRFYCGLCQTLGEAYDTPTRALLSHDAVFLALLADALIDEAAPPSSCRCPMLPVVHRPTASPSSAALQYAAGVQMLLADQYLADRAMDGRRVHRAARSLLTGRVQKARALLGSLGVDLDALDGFEQRQGSCEVRGETDAAAAAEPTAAALSLVFGQLVDLPGAGFALRSGASRRALASLGRAVGQVIYLVDALEDLRKDLLDHAFNPCLGETPAGPVIDPARVERCVALLLAAQASMRASLAVLPWKRHRVVVENILLGQLGGQAADAIRAARAWSSVAGQRHLDRLRAAWWQRWSETAWLALAFLWTSLFSLSAAQAQGRPPRPLPPGRLPRPDAGAPPPDGGTSTGASGSPTGGGSAGGSPSGVNPAGGGATGGSPAGGPDLDAGAPDGGCPDAGMDGGLDGGLDAGLDGGCPDGGLDAGLLDGGLDAGLLDGGRDGGLLDGGTGPGGLPGPGCGGGHGRNPCVGIFEAIGTCLSSMCKGFADCFRGFGGCIKGILSCDPCSGCHPERCCDPCSGCMKSCCDPCKDCGGCGHCSNPCSGCDPCKDCGGSGCCNSCNGCGNGCNGCGNGCNGCGNGCHC